MDKIIKLNIDKSKWKTSKLGDVASEVSVRVDNPSKSKYDRFVGLEHFESGELKVRQWSTTSSLTSSAKAFQKGDVLFARRNAYLRRASIAEFDGCCSGDAFVLREIHEMLVPGFLAFLVNSSELWDYANLNAAGTMSKRVKWNDLANFELLLPPKVQQTQLVELLSAMAEVIDTKYMFDKTLKSASHIFISRLLSESAAVNQQIKLGELVKITTGKLDSNAAVTDGKYPFFTCDSKTFLINQFSFDCEALLLAGNNAAGIFPLKHYKGKFDAYQRTYVITINDTSMVCYTYLFEILKSQLDLLRRMSVGSSTKFLTMGLITNLKLPLPSLDEQTKIVDKIKALNATEKILEINLKTSKKLLSNLINQIF